jgi:hypothetical protein
VLRKAMRTKALILQGCLSAAATTLARVLASSRLTPDPYICEDTISGCLAALRDTKRVHIRAAPEHYAPPDPAPTARESQVRPKPTPCGQPFRHGTWEPEGITAVPRTHRPTRAGDTD